MPIYLALASWRKHPSAWRWTRPWRRSPNREDHCLSSPARDLYENDKGDLRRFLFRGASARCGGSRNCQSHPHTSYTRFQSKRYFQGEQGSKPNRISLQTRSQVKRRSQSNDGSYSPFQFKPCFRFQQYYWCDSVSNFPTRELARSWAHSALQKKLGADLIRPMDPSGSGGVPSGADGGGQATWAP